MTNLEFLKYLRENKIVSFEDTFEPEQEENALFVWDWDGWHEVLIWFDNEGNVIKSEDIKDKSKDILGELYGITGVI